MKSRDPLSVPPPPGIIRINIQINKIGGAIRLVLVLM